MARQDRKLRCLPHELLLMQPVVCTCWAAWLPQTCVFFVFHSPDKWTQKDELHCLFSDNMTNVYAEWVKRRQSDQTLGHLALIPCAHAFEIQGLKWLLDRRPK